MSIRLVWRGTITAAVVLCASSLTLAQTEVLTLDVGPYGLSSTAMTSDARVVAISTASSLVPQDTGNADTDIYVLERSTAQWSLLPRSVLLDGYENLPGPRLAVRGLSD